MKTVTFVFAFLSVMAFSVSRIAATDPEPIGAETSLYAVGLMLAVVCAIAFSRSAARRPAPCSWLVAFCAGALSSAIFFSSIAFAVPVFPLSMAGSAGSMAAVLCAWAAPRFFR
jgi:uncharacterized membrane protein YdcZ (DUF606 family)